MEHPSNHPNADPSTTPEPDEPWFLLHKVDSFIRSTGEEMLVGLCGHVISPSRWVINTDGSEEGRKPKGRPIDCPACDAVLLLLRGGKS